MSIFGAGGGGSKGKSGGGSGGANEAKDNLDSTAYAKIIELLSEGEIEGFATPSRLNLAQGSTAYMNASMKDMFFNKTPLLRAAASNTSPQEADFNFKNVQVATRFGTQAQSYVPGFDAIEAENGVGADVLEGAAVTRRINDSNVNAVRVTINVPILQEIKDNGDIVGAIIDLRIAVQYNDGGFTTVINDRIAGRTTDLYQRDYIINLTPPSTPGGSRTVDIRVSRVTPDSTSAKLNNSFSWFSYTELIYQKLKYPNSAYVALRIDAEQFSSIPGRSYKIRGIKVRIPNNATVDRNTGRLVYSGIWNGQFGAAQWTTDPSWILFDLITNSRYGLGDHIQETTLDKWAFFRASQYCNELVPTGLTSPVMEPRFSCNVNIQTQEEAYKLINDMCSVFRAMPFWASGSLTVAQDRPTDPVAIFSLANVSEEGFNYEGSSIKGRATVVIVSWLNIELGDVDREIVEDVEGIAKYGVITKEVEAFATTSRSQANRIGEWLLYTERYETEVVSFATGLENGVILRPGSIIEIADPVKAGVRQGGRISAATSTVITVDSDKDLPISGRIAVVMPDGIVESRQISFVNGRDITVTSAFSNVPFIGSMWIIDNPDVRPTQWRVLAVQEQEGINYAVNAVSYNSSKYNFIERGQPLETRSISVLNAPPEAPTALTAVELFYVLNGRVATKLSVSWRPVRGVNEYRVRWRGDFTNWTDVTVYGPICEIEDVTDGNYQIEVYAISPTLILSSAPSILNVTVQGVTAPPSNVTGVSLVPVNESTAIIQWNLATELDVLVGGEVLIRHDPRPLPVAEWATSNAIVQAAAGNQTQKQVPLLAGTYFLAFRDQSRVRSLIPTPVVAVLPTPQPRLTLKTWAEQEDTPPFNGIASNLVYNSNLSGLLLSPASTTVANSLAYRWFATDGSNPTTKTGFDALFSGAPSGTGIQPGPINWPDVGSRPAYLPSTNFAWEVSGTLIVTQGGSYRFRTTSDDGNELKVDGQIVTSFYGGRAPAADTSAAISLAAGNYSFVYRMQQGGGGAAAIIEWETPGSGSFVVIPASAYLATIGGTRNGSYVYEDTLDLGNVYDINIRRRLVSNPIAIVGTLFDSVEGLFDEQEGDFDGTSLDVVNAVTYIRATNDDPAATPAWGPWNEYANAIVRGRAIQLKIEAATQSSQVGILVSELGATAELQQRTETGSRSGAASYTVTFANAFYQTPEIAVSPSNLLSGDYYTISGQSRTGFAISFFDSTNTAVTRSFTYNATGFGRQV